MKTNRQIFSKIRGGGNGFTIVESLVAITLLLLSIAGPLTLVVQGLRSSYYSSTQITAFYLAQDAVEYVRNVRDNNGLANRGGADIPWLMGLDACVTNARPDNPLSSERKCYIDTTTTPTCPPGSGCTSTGATICPGGVCPKLLFNSSTGRYSYTNGDPASLYTREIQIVPIDNDGTDGIVNGPSGAIATGDVSVIVTVTWQAPFFPAKTIKVKTNLFNWQS